MATGLINLIKRAALDAVDNTKPCDLKYGLVISVDPLLIKITDNFIIPESMLTVPEHLKNRKVKVSILQEDEWETEPSELEPIHDHDIVINEKKVFMHGGLKFGDRVVLINHAGGQHFLILCRL